MKCKKIHFSGHATIQMFKRSITVEQVEEVIEMGKIIKMYPEDKPHPSYLMLGYSAGHPLHVVISADNKGNCFIITAYEPDKKIWNENFENKK